MASSFLRRVMKLCRRRKNGRKTNPQPLSLQYLEPVLELSISLPASSLEALPSPLMLLEADADADAEEAEAEAEEEKQTPSAMSEEEELESVGREYEECEAEGVAMVTMVQVFVKTCQNPSKPTVIWASPSEVLQAVCNRVRGGRGGQLLFDGKLLCMEGSLVENGVENGTTLHLLPAAAAAVALPESWILAKEVIDVCTKLESASTPSSTRDRRRLGLRQDFLLRLLASFLQSLPNKDACVEIFQVTGVPEALAALYASPTLSNNSCADRCIKALLTGHTNEQQQPVLPKQALALVTPLLLRLCKLIADVYPDRFQYHALLASLLDDSAFVAAYLDSHDPLHVVHSLKPVIHQISSALRRNLKNLSKSETLWFSSAFGSDVNSFHSFLIPLCKAITNISSRLSSIHITHQKLWLYRLFQKQLQSLRNCLFMLFEYDPMEKALPLLTIVKALHVIAKLIPAAMEGLHYLFCSHTRKLNLLIQRSQLTYDDHTWLVEFKSYLESDTRKNFALSLLPKLEDGHNTRKHHIYIRRPLLLEDSFDRIAFEAPEELQGGIDVEFEMEEATGPGVLREWFSLTCKEIFNPANALFKSCPNDPRRIFPNPASGVNPEHLAYFRFCGRVIALALIHKIEMGTILDLAFFKQLAGLSISWTDIKDADPDLYGSCGKLLEMDAAYIDSDVLSLTFATAVEHLGSYKTVELCPGGEEVKVDSRNRLAYMDLLVQSVFVLPIKEQVKAFSQGFSDLLQSGSCDIFFQILQPEDLELMLYGKDQDIPVQDWKEHTEYHQYKASDEQIKWFWKVVKKMDMEQRRKLLHFSTSLSHLPVGGFAALPNMFHIYRSSPTETNHFPSAHTCFHQLVLPPYPSFKIMHDRLHAVIQDHISQGFGFI